MASSKQRLIVPDFARGLALAGIAMANITSIWISNEVPGATGPTVGWVEPGKPGDALAALFAAMFVHVRGLPMFSTLLGFGVGLLCISLRRKGYPAKNARRKLAWRYFLLALFGLAHMFLLFHGDIMFTYGLAGVLIAMMITLRTRTLRVIAYIFLAIGMSFGLLSFLAALGGENLYIQLPPTAEIASIRDYVSWNMGNGSMGAPGALYGAIFAVIELLGVMLIGFIWAREGVLADVDAHRRVLNTWAVLAIAVVLFIGIPWGLGAAGLLSEKVEFMFMGLNVGFGLLTGPGALAILALAFNGLQKRHNAAAAQGQPPSTPVYLYPFIALGKRSMSGYLMQSILFIPLLMPFGLGLGQDATVGGKMLIGLGVWVITLVLATILEATGTPGPFEWAHRHLAYGRTGRLEPYSGPDALPAGQPTVPGQSVAQGQQAASGQPRVDGGEQPAGPMPSRER